MTETTESINQKALESLFGGSEMTESGPSGTAVASGTVAREKAMRVKYWRKPDGWITIGPDVATDAPKYQQYTQNKRYRELPDAFGKEVMGKGTIQTSKPGAANHTWLRTFIANGGLTYRCKGTDPFGSEGEYLMPKEQIVRYNMHRDPAVREARPDVCDAVDLECPYGCIDQNTKKTRLFSGVDEKDAQGSVDQHIVAAHSEAIASRAVGQTIADQLSAFQGQNVNQDNIAAIVTAVVQAMSQANNTEQKAVAQQSLANQEEPSDTLTQEPPRVVESHDLSSMKRHELMSHAKEKGIPFPKDGIKKSTQEWLDYIRSYEQAA